MITAVLYIINHALIVHAPDLDASDKLFRNINT